jgi:hypothetical protein
VTGCGGQRPKHRPLNPREREPVPIVQEARWAPRPVWTHMYSKAITRVRTSNRPPHSGSIFHARGHRVDLFVWIRSTCVYQWKNCMNVTTVGIFLTYQCGARIDFSSRAWPCAHECGHHIPYTLFTFSQYVEVYTLTRAQIARLGQLTFYGVVNTSQNSWARWGNITENIPTLAHSLRFTVYSRTSSGRGLAGKLHNCSIVTINI